MDWKNPDLSPRIITLSEIIGVILIIIGISLYAVPLLYFFWLYVKYWQSSLPSAPVFPQLFSFSFVLSLILTGISLVWMAKKAKKSE